jgi:hypothetical protein
VTFETIGEHTKRIRNLIGEIDQSTATEIESTIILAVAHLTSAVETLAAHVASQQTDGK